MTTRNDAKQRETTCGDAEDVDGINRHVADETYWDVVGFREGEEALGYGVNDADTDCRWLATTRSSAVIPFRIAEHGCARSAQKTALWRDLQPSTLMVFGQVATGAALQVEGQGCAVTDSPTLFNDPVVQSLPPLMRVASTAPAGRYESCQK